MKGVIFHDKENDSAYMVYLVQGEYALCLTFPVNWTHICRFALQKNCS